MLCSLPVCPARIGLSAVQLTEHDAAPAEETKFPVHWKHDVGAVSAHENTKGLYAVILLSDLSLNAM